MGGSFRHPKLPFYDIYYPQEVTLLLKLPCVIIFVRLLDI